MPAFRLDVAILTFSLIAAPLLADEGWPQFRGLGGEGHSAATNLPVTWSETENVAWKAPIPGKGWSSPVIWGDQIWLTTAINDGQSLRAVCINRDSGTIEQNVDVFQPSAAVRVNPKNSHASPTPVIEEGRLYVHFGTMGTACLNTQSGEVLWKNTELQIDHKEGPGSSPILYKNLLIVNCDGMDVQYVAALDKTSGKLVWKTDRTGPFYPDPDQRKAYTTPLIVNAAGRDQLISPASDKVISYDPDTGQEIWKVVYRGYSNVPRPVFGHGLAFICTGYNTPQLWAIRPDGQGEVTETHVAWKYTKQVSANPSPLLIGEEIYFVSDKGVATCLDAKTGKEHWTERLGGNYSASPLYADGRIYCCSEDGECSVVEPGQTFKLLATNQIDGQTLASPAVVDGALFIRSDSHLYRIESKR